MKVLASEATVRVNGEWRILRAVLVSVFGGKRVVYFDKDGKEVYSEALSKSQFKSIVKKSCNSSIADEHNKNNMDKLEKYRCEKCGKFVDSYHGCTQENGKWFCDDCDENHC